MEVKDGLFYSKKDRDFLGKERKWRIIFMVVYKALYAEEICRELFKDFIRHQIVTKCWRKENGKNSDFLLKKYNSF